MEETIIIQLPSDATKVSVENIWKMLNTIGKVGKVFSKEDIVKNGDATLKSYDIVARILNYLKYLGILQEVRRKSKINDKEKFIQEFELSVKDQEVSKLYYFLQESRIDDAKLVWKQILQKHNLYSVISQQLFSENKIATIRELQDNLNKTVDGDHKATYFSRGAIFIANLFKDAGLVRFDGNKIELLEKIETSQQPLATIKGQVDITKEPIETSKDSHLVIMMGDNRFDFDIESESDWEIFDVVGKSLKKKWLESKQKEKTKGKNEEDESQ